jgi:NitT/TauT family transport system substrate-binding protein
MKLWERLERLQRLFSYPMKQRILTFLALPLLSFFYPCVAVAQRPALQNVVVSYPSKSITSYPILDTAKRKGFFQQQGLNVSLVYMRGGLDIKAVLTGDADFGTSTTTAVTAFVAGAPVRIVCSYNSHVDQVLIAQPKYRSIAQLKGQPIGSLNPGGLIDVLLRRVLVANGLNPDRDVVLLAMGGTPERYAAMKAGNIAATMLSSPYNFLAEKEGFFRLAATRDYVDVSGTAVITYADRIKKDPELVKKFIRASVRAIAYIRENKPDTIQMIMREFAMNQEIAALAYNQLLELLSEEGRMHLDAFQLMVDFARAAQKVDRPISASQLIDPTLLDEVLREAHVPR